MKKLLLLASLLMLSANYTHAADLYWVGGSGLWSDALNHWSATSGGAPGATVPAAGDNAIFDAASGLVAIDIVTLDIAVEINSLDFSAVPVSFTYDSPVAIGVIIHGSITGNVSGVLFTGTWPLVNMATTLVGESITSGGTIWNVQDFLFSGEQVTLIDDFNIATRTLQIDNGGIDALGNTITCGTFLSNSILLRDIDISGSVVNVSNGIWDIDGTNLIWTAAASEILLGDLAGVAMFTGGALAYDKVRSTSATTLDYYDNNAFGLFEVVASSNLHLNNGDALATDSMIASGTCFAPTVISTIAAGVNATFIKTGVNTLNLSGMDITNVDAFPVATYNLAISDTVNSTGWTKVGSDFYWIGDGGDWTDPNHWSLSSGGPIAGCIPTLLDAVFFDLNSFTVTGQNVLVDDIAFFKSMEWVGIFGNQTLSLDSLMQSYGDVLLHPNLTVVRNEIASGIQFNDQANLDPNGATIDCTFLVSMPTTAEQVLLTSDLVMSDTSSIILFNGKFFTQNNDVRTGSLRTVNNPLDGGDLRELDFGSSFVHLLLEFGSLGDTTLVLNAGTSYLYVGDTIQLFPDTVSYYNGLNTEGLTFFDVTLNFQPLTLGGFPIPQSVKGANTFNILEVIPGSHVYFQSAITQTVNDSLIFQGNCKDSIWLYSTTNGVQALINKLVSTDIIAHCLNVKDMDYTTPSITAYFSTDLGNNSANWIFSPLNATDASFTFVGQGGAFCYGDTVFFTNTSTAFSGDFNDLTSSWIFNDDAMVYPDTSAHVFLGGGDFDVVLITEYTNFCVDTTSQIVSVSRPLIAMTTTELDQEICQGDSVTFEVSSPEVGTSFEFFVNGISVLGPGINDTLYTTTMLNDGDIVSSLSYVNGCTSDTMPQMTFTVNPLPVYTMNSSDPDFSICAGDLVSFDAVGGLPTDLYQYLLNGTIVTSQTLAGLYSTTGLADNDVLTLTGQTAEGCKDTVDFVFNVDPLPLTSLTSTQLGTVICNGTNVTFTASGATTYIFYLNGAPIGPQSPINTYSNSMLTANDTITVEGFFPTGCSFVAPQSFYYNILSTPTVNILSSDIDATICGGDNVLFTASGAVNYEFFINGVSQGALSPINTFSTTGITNGQIVTAMGQVGGCFGTSPGITFTVVTSPTTSLLSSDADNIICQGDQVTFNGTGATNYQFFVNGVSQGPSSPLDEFITTSLINGQTVSVQGESNGCIVTDQLTITVLPTPSISLFSSDPDNTICNGNPITLTTANAASYQLYVNGSTFGPPQVVPTFVNPALPFGANSVYVVGTAANGCSSSSLPALTITVNPIPVVTNVSSDADNIICAGEAVTFTGSGSNLYQFYVNGIAQTGLTATSNYLTTSLTNGQTVTILGSSLGCTSISNPIATTVNPNPIVNLTSNDLNNIWCIDQVVNFNAVGATNYEFIVDGVSQGPSSPVNTINSSTFVSGSYTVQVIGEQSNCFGSDAIGITINDLPTASILTTDIDNTICAGQNITYIAGGGSSFQFFVDGVSQGPSSAINSFSSTSLTNGQVVSVIVTSNSGCTASAAAAALTVNPVPVTTLVSSDLDLAICNGDNVTFTAGGATNYEFFLNGLSQGAPSPVFTLATSTLALGDVVGVTGSSLGCFNSPSSLTFTVYNAPVVSLTNNGNLQICTGELTDLTASGATNYQFLINGLPFGPFSPVATLNTPLNNGNVVTVIGETNGCPGASLNSYTYTVFTYPTVTTTSSDADNEICLDELVSFTASGGMTYEFALNGDVLQAGATTTFNISTLVDGDIISVTALNGDCASTPDTYTFTVNSMNLDLTASPSNLICEGDAVTITATGGDEYEFFVNGTSTGPMSVTDTYTSSTFSDLDEVTLTAFNTTTGCTQDYNDNIIMNVVDEPSITALSALNFCEGDSVVLVSSASHGNQWYVDGAIIPGATDTSYTAYTSGVYSLETTAGGLGTIWSFGQNANGTFGNGENLNSADPVAAITTEIFDEITTGYNFILGVTTAGELYAWGDNSSGQLGDGTYTSSNLPQIVPTLSNVKTAAASESSSMAVTDAGDVYVWGNNTNGQLGTGNTSVVNFPFLNVPLANMDSIAGGRNHFVMLKNNGTVWTVGNNDYGQLGQGNLTSSMNAVQVPGLANVVSVGAGEFHSFAINNVGDLYVWGNNGSGQLGLGDLNNRLNPTLSGLDNIINAQGGASHSAFLSSDEKVFTSGANGFGQLGSTDYVASTTPIEVSVPGAVMISTGQYTTLVKRTDKSVFGFGNNTEDQLSSLSGLTVPTPEHISDLDGVDFIEAGRFNSHFIYNEDQVCVATSVTVTMLTTPAVTISVDVDTLSTIAGASYQWYYNTNPIPGATNQTHVVTNGGSFYVEVTFANGCVGTSPVHVHSMAELNELAFGNVILYPNPTESDVNLIFSKTVAENTTYAVMDQAGRIVMQGDIMGTELTLDVRELESGLYNVIIANDLGMHNMRFVKGI